MVVRVSCTGCQSYLAHSSFESDTFAISQIQMFVVFCTSSQGQKFDKYTGKTPRVWSLGIVTIHSSVWSFTKICISVTAEPIYDRILAWNNTMF